MQKVKFLYRVAWAMEKGYNANALYNMFKAHNLHKKLSIDRKYITPLYYYVTAEFVLNDYINLDFITKWEASEFFIKII